MSTLHITVSRFRDLVTPVLPLADAKGNDLPAINSVQIKATPAWLRATATDSFRVGCQRMAAGDDSWPEWEALLPVSTVKGILSNFKVGRGDDADLALTLKGDVLLVESDVALLDMLRASIEYPLLRLRYPAVDSLIAKAAADTKDVETGEAWAAFNWRLLAGFPKTESLAIRVNDGKSPAFVTDGENFVGAIMPRKKFKTGALDLPSGWADLLAAPSSEKAEDAA